MAEEIDLLILGHQVRHARRRKGVTLAEVSSMVGRPAPYLSQLENGKVEPKLSLVGELAEVLDSSTAALLDPNPPDRRSELEVRLARAQRDPRFVELGLPHLKPTAKVGDDVLENVLGLWDAFAAARPLGAASAAPTAVVSTPEPEGERRVADRARAANLALRDEMRECNNHYPEIEEVAAKALAAAGYAGSGPISERVLTELAAWFGFTIERVDNMPRTARSITDTRDRVIFIPDRGGLRIRQARSVVLQTLGHFALEHRGTTDFGDYLRQRIESNYFAAAVLAPEQPAVEFLTEAKEQNDISVEDLKEVFYISYEMAAHRFTNLATVHLGIPCHFLRTDREGVIDKAYENDGMVFPSASDGGLEGERVPRQWGSRQAWNAHGSFLLHGQYTVTDNGEYFCITYIETETDRSPYSISLGTPAVYAPYFRGHDTLRREYARATDIEPETRMVEEWSEIAWPSAAERSHVLSAMPPSDRQFTPFPGIDLLDVYRFLDRRRRA